MDRPFIIAIPFVFVDRADSPNVKTNAGEPASASYLRAMTCCLASIRRWNPQASIALVCNSRPPEPFRSVFAQLQVDVRLANFEHEPPDGHCAMFETSFFLVDALADLFGSNAVLIDPDVLCLRSLDRFINRVDGQVAALPIDYSEHHDINGLTRSAASRLHALLGEDSVVPTHFGGECVYVPAELQQELLDRMEAAWLFSLQRFASNKSRFTTEEHLLSYAFRSFDVVDLSTEVKRIWTAARFRNVDGREGDLSLWHLPAEKGRGFDALYEACLDMKGWFWTCPQAEFTIRAGRSMGLHGRSLTRTARDSVGRCARTLRLV